ncbi:MAG: hypothetical protein DRJ29_10135 [Bacteroidetes bacterium]|nr:MAG: hypothetical protein DRJ13_16675 [Bacteroidota bacterium]RLD92998.1 MAG: hypothetical protein DRJ29_10135 [Bacteroidota bacterium]
MVFADQYAMRGTFILILIFVLSAGSLLAQGELDEQRRVMLRDERTFAGFLNSNGWGANYRYGYWRNYRNQFIIDADFAYVKHPKEVKTSVPYNYNTYRYVYGKENLFWELKGTAGWQKELYRKIDRNGISVRLYYAGGISLGFAKPIYYKVFTTSPVGEVIYEEYLKFDPSIHQALIGGRGPFFMGFNELKVIPGLYGKTGFSFEYSQKDAIVHALEAGISITAYPKEIPIMANEHNSWIFFTLNVGYRFGRIIDISDAARSKSRKQKKAERKAAKTAASSPVY